MNLAFRLEQGGAPRAEAPPAAFTVNWRLSQWLTVDLCRRFHRGAFRQGGDRPGASSPASARSSPPNSTSPSERVHGSGGPPGTSPDEGSHQAACRYRSQERPAPFGGRCALLFDKTARRLGGRPVIWTSDGKVIPRDGVAAGLADTGDLAGAVSLDHDQRHGGTRKAIGTFREGVTVTRAPVLPTRCTVGRATCTTWNCRDMLHGRCCNPRSQVLRSGPSTSRPVRAMPTWYVPDAAVGRRFCRCGGAKVLARPRGCFAALRTARPLDGQRADR